MEGLHGGDHRQGLGAPLAGIAGEDRVAARVAAGVEGGDHPPAQRLGILQPQVEPLAGQRMDHMGGIPHQRQA